MEITWEDSGKGPINLTLAQAQHLAVQGGFVFNADSAQPISKRANLQSKLYFEPISHYLHHDYGPSNKKTPSRTLTSSQNFAEMFDHFGVNSLTAFRQKFSTYELNPTVKDKTSSKPVWGSQQRGSEQYVGQLVDGQRHGPGVLLCEGSSAPYVYIGSFSNGLRNGYGIILSPRGETFQGFLKDDIMWGPGSYTWARPGGESTANVRHRVRFDGMHNGRPCGKGILVWSDGERQSGEFDGVKLVREIELESCEGVVLVAHENAEMAKRVAAETEEELRRHDVWDESMVQRGRGGGSAS